MGALFGMIAFVRCEGEEPAAEDETAAEEETAAEDEPAAEEEEAAPAEETEAGAGCCPTRLNLYFFHPAPVSCSRDLLRSSLDISFNVVVTSLQSIFRLSTFLFYFYIF